VINRAISYAVT